MPAEPTPKELTIIVPLYNEAERMPPFVEALTSYAPTHLPEYEIIFVDDGSTDESLAVLNKLVAANPDCRILHYDKNQGKGRAVKYGVEGSSGKNIIFVDIDGSILPEAVKDILLSLGAADVVLGVRSQATGYSAPAQRRLLSYAFNLIVNALFQLQTPDTLCGIKGFRRETALELFGGMGSKGWVFDVELLYLAKDKGKSIASVPIRWVYKKGTRMRLTTPFKMLFELVKLRIRLS